MKVIEYGLLDYLSKVKVLGEKTPFEIEKIIGKPNYSTGKTTYPYMIIDSYKGKIIDQQLVTATYFDMSQETFETREYNVHAYHNDKDILISGTSRINPIKIKFLRESILFDIYIRNTKLKHDKELIAKYIEYNEALLNRIRQDGYINKGLSSIVDMEVYGDFVTQMLFNKKYGAK